MSISADSLVFPPATMPDRKALDRSFQFVPGASIFRMPDIWPESGAACASPSSGNSRGWEKGAGGSGQGVIALSPVKAVNAQTERGRHGHEKARLLRSGPERQMQEACQSAEPSTSP